MVVPDNAAHARQVSFTVDAPFTAERTMNLTVWPFSKEDLNAVPPFSGSSGPSLAIYDVTVFPIGTTQTGFKVSAQFTERGVSIGKQFEVFLDYTVIV